MATSKTNTKKGATPKAPETIDVRHEDVPFTPHAPAVPAPLKIYTTAEITELYLQQLSPAEQQLAELEAKYADLTAPIPLDDATAYRAGKDAWREVQGFRTRVENQALSMRREQNTINKAISTKEGQLVGRATPLEKRLQDRWKAVDEEKERLEREEEARQEAQLRARLDELVDLGMTLVAGYYSIGNTVSVDVATLRVMPPENFALLKEAVVARAGELRAEQERKEREEREEQQRLEQERQEQRRANKEMRSMVVESLGLAWEAESQRYWWTNVDDQFGVTEAELYDVSHAAFTDKITEIKQKIAAYQHKKEQRAREERERQAREARQQRDRTRFHALAQAGLHPRGAFVQYEDGFNEPLVVAFDPLLDLEDKAFEARVSELSDQVGLLRTKLLKHQDEERQKAEALKQRKTEVAQKMADLGYKYDYAKERFTFELGTAYTNGVDFAHLLSLDEASLQKFLHEEHNIIKTAREQHVREEKRREEEELRERQAGQTDAQNFAGYLAALAVLKVPAMKTKKGQAHAQAFAGRLSALLVEFEPKSAKKKEVES